MSMNDPFGNQQWDQPTPPPPRPGMSSGTKVLLILAIIFGVLLLICCGGFILMGIFARNYMGEAMSQDPAVVRQITERILPKLKIPEPLQPEASMDMRIPFTDQTVMTMVFWTHKPSDSALVLTAMGEAFAGQNQEQMRQQIEQQLRQQGIRPAPEREGQWETEKSEKEFEIRGEKVTLQFVKHKRTDADGERIEVTGTLPGEQGPVMLMLSADTALLSEQQAIEMLKSIE